MRRATIRSDRRPRPAIRSAVDRTERGGKVGPLVGGDVPWSCPTRDPIVVVTRSVGPPTPPALPGIEATAAGGTEVVCSLPSAGAWLAPACGPTCNTGLGPDAWAPAPAS